MDALREGVYLRGYAQKDPLIEYKTEAYDMFVELMANIKNEVLHNLFRSTSNLQAFENFLASLAAVSPARAGADRADGHWPTRACVSRSRRDGRGGRRRQWRWRRRSDARSAGPPRNAEGRPQRAVPLRQREEIQELLRSRRVTERSARSLQLQQVAELF